MMIGKFEENNDGYSGEINCLALHVPAVVFNPMPIKQGSVPDFVVASSTEAGEDYEIGAAWKKTSKDGKPYLSVRLDGPTLATAINAALTRQQDGSYALLWNRPKPKKEGDASAEQSDAAAA